MPHDNEVLQDLLSFNLKAILEVRDVVKTLVEYQKKQDDERTDRDLDEVNRVVDGFRTSMDDVMGKMASTIHIEAPNVTIPAPIVNVAQQAIPAPVVNVPAPIVNVASPEVIVENEEVLKRLDTLISQAGTKEKEEPLELSDEDRTILKDIIEKLDDLSKKETNVTVKGGGSGGSGIANGQYRETMSDLTASQIASLRFTKQAGLHVNLRDANGNELSLPASPTEYTEDTAAVANPVGGQVILRRRDALAAETTTDGDHVALNATNKGEAYVKNVDEETLTGAVTETAPATDTASSGLNGRLQRIAQRITSLIALLPAALGAGGGLKVDGSGTALPVSVASLPLPSGASTLAEQQTQTTHLASIAGEDFATQTTLAAVLTELGQKTEPADQQHVIVDSSALPSGASTLAEQQTQSTALAAIKIAVEILDNIVAGSEAQVDIVAPVPTGTNAIGRVGHDITGIAHGTKAVTTAGTDVALAGSTACKKVDIQAYSANTGVIAVGATGVDATLATGTGIILYKDEVYSLEIDNLADVFIDSTVSGEGVRFTYYT